MHRRLASMWERPKVLALSAIAPSLSIESHADPGPMPRSATILANRERTYLKSLGHLGGEHWELREGEMSRGDGYAFAIGHLDATSFDEFLKFLEFFDWRPGPRCKSTASRDRALNFPPRTIRQMPGSHCCIHCMVYNLLTNYRTC